MNGIIAIGYKLCPSILGLVHSGLNMVHVYTCHYQRTKKNARTKTNVAQGILGPKVTFKFIPFIYLNLINNNFSLKIYSSNLFKCKKI